MHFKRGFAPVLIIVVVVVVAAAGYFLLQKKGVAPTLPGVANLGLNPNCKYNDPDLCKFFNKMMTGDFMKNGFAGTSTMTDKSGKKTVSRFESQGADKTHMMTTENGKETFNFIQIGNATYMKDYSDSKWLKTVTEATKPEGKQTSGFNADEIKKMFNKEKQEEDKTTYKKIGKEKCGQYNCFKYQVMNPAVMVDITEYIFFDDSSYTMRKTQTVSQNGTVTEFEFDYNPVSISEPSPLKTLPNGTKVMPIGPPGTGMSQEQLQKLMEQYQNNPPGE